MKWNRFIVSDANSDRTVSPISHLDTSRHSSKGKTSNFHLKSCQKVKMSASEYRNMDNQKSEQQNLNDSAIRKMISRISVRGELQSQIFDKPQEKSNEKQPLLPQGNQLGKLVQLFNRELDQFIHNFFSKYEALKIKLEQKETLKKSFAEVLHHRINKYLEDHQVFVFAKESPLKKTKTQVQTINSNENRRNRATMLKNELISSKNGISIDQAEPEESNIFKQRRRTDRFQRSGGRGSRTSRKEKDLNSSNSDILEKSLNESYRSSKNRLKAKEILYQFSKVLHNNK